MEMTPKEVEEYARKSLTGERPTIHNRVYWEGAYRYEPYPAMWYRAYLAASGNVELEWEKARGPEDEPSLMARGFRDHPLKAFSLYEEHERYYAEQAANKAYQDAHLRSDAAKREAAAQDAATESHVTHPREAERLERSKREK